MLIVLDTNVLVSALLKQPSNPASVLDSVLEGQVRLAVDQRIFEEYTEVLHRPKLNIQPAHADAILRFIAQSALWVEPEPVAFQLDLVLDQDDLPFGEVAVCSRADALVSGNIKHFMFLSEFGIKVLTPQEFLSEYRL
jgi:putative PIN family toxin of toxin-antitoxin system